MEDIYCLVMFSISYQFSGVYYNLYVGIIFLNIYWDGIKILLPGNGTKKLYIRIVLSISGNSH